MSKTEKIFWCITILTFIIFLLFQPSKNFQKNPTKKNPSSTLSKKPHHQQNMTFGNPKTIHLHNLRIIMPHPAIPLRNHIKTWIVNVPLTPFKAPLITLPPLKTKKLPPYLLYKPDLLTPVRNQGDCGSCWVFSVCDMLSDRAMITSGGLFDKNLSVQQLLSCFDRDGCDGGSPEDLCFWLEKNKIKIYTESLMKYKQQKGGVVTTICPKKLKGSYIEIQKNSVKSLVQFIDEHKYDKNILNSNINNMKKELYEGGPFYSAISVYDDFFTYGGLTPYKPGKNAILIGGHAIEIIGYCDKGQDPRPEFKNISYWICKNSWGKDWPTKTVSNGYFTIISGQNICGIESRCGFAIPKVFGKFHGVPLKLNELRFETFTK